MCDEHQASTSEYKSTKFVTSDTHHELGEELIKKDLNEQKGKVMLVLRDRALHLFMSEMISIIVPRDVMARAILDYMGEGDPIQYIKKNESTLLGWRNDDNHFTLLFPDTLAGNASYKCFGLPRETVTSFLDLKADFIQHYMGECQLLKNVTLWMMCDRAAMNRRHAITTASTRI